MRRADVPIFASLPEQIARTIADAIIRGEYKPGERLREQHLAELFQVSRSSIREAMRLLERDGVVVIAARRGAAVSKLTTDEMVEIYQLRAVVYGLAARLFAGRRAEAELAELRRRFDEMSSVERSDVGNKAAVYARISAEMAEIIVERCGNLRVIRLFQQMSLQIARYTALGLATPKRRKESLANWKRLIAAVAEKSGTEAETVARRMVDDTLAAAVGELISQEKADAA